MKRQSIFLLLIMFFLFFSIFFYRQIAFDEIVYCCDNLLINIPARIFWVKSLLSGVFPIDSPFLFSGSPFLADINVSPLYPGNVVFLFFEPFRGMTIVTLFHIGLAGVGMLWVTGVVQMTFWSRMIATIVFVFSGTIVSYTNNLPMLQVASWLPLVFSSWILYCSRPSKKTAILVVSFSVLQILAGHIQLIFYSFLLCYVYALIFLRIPFVYRVMRLVFICLATIFFALPQLLPFVLHALHSTRIGSGFSYATFGSLQILAIFRFFLPSIVGNLSEGTEWWQGGSMYGYIGITPWILFFSFLVRRKWSSHELFFSGIGILSFLLAFGSSTPIFSLFYHLIPGIRLFRVPSHFLLLFTFSFAMFSGYALQRGLSKKIVALSSIFFFVMWFGFVAAEDSIYRMLFSLNYSSLQRKLAFLGDRGVQTIFSMIQQNALLFGCGLLGIYAISSRFSRLSNIAVVLFLFLDLFLYARMNLITLSYHVVMTWKAEQERIVQEIRERTEDGYRFYVHPSLYPSPYMRVFGEPWIEREVLWQFRMFRPNLLMIYNIPIVDGYASMIDRRYQALFGVPANDPTGVAIPDTAVDVLRSLRVRYIFLPHRVEDSPLLAHLSFLWENPYIRLYELR